MPANKARNLLTSPKGVTVDPRQNDGQPRIAAEAMSPLFVKIRQARKLLQRIVENTLRHQRKKGNAPIRSGLDCNCLRISMANSAIGLEEQALLTLSASGVSASSMKAAYRDQSRRYPTRNALSSNPLINICIENGYQHHAVAISDAIRYHQHVPPARTFREKLLVTNAVGGGTHRQTWMMRQTSASHPC